MLTEAVVGRPDPRLRPYVDRYLGYRERAAAPLVRQEVAGAFVVLILGWGAALDVTDPRAAGRGASEGRRVDGVRPEVLSDVYDLDIEVHELAGRRIGTYYR